MSQIRSPIKRLASSRLLETEPSYRWVILAITFSAFAVAYMQRLSLGPLAPFMIAAMNISNAEIGLISSAATLGYGVTLIPAGWVADRLGVRATLALGQVIAGVLLISMLFAESFIMVIVVMFGAGLGLGFISPSCVRGIVTWFPLNERAMAMGINNMSVNMCGIVTAVSLPVIAIAYNWHYAFMILGSISILSGLVPATFYRDPPKSEEQVHVPNERQPEITVPHESWLTVFKTREIWLIILGGSSLYIAEFGVLTYFVVYLKSQLLIPVTAAGILLGAIDFGGFVGKPVAGLMSDRILGGRRKGTFMALSAISTVLACVFALLTPGTPQWLILMLCIIFGFAAVGWGGIYYTMVGECAGKENVGIVTGACSSGLVMANVVGVPIFGYLSDMTGSWMCSWAYLVILGLIGMIALYFVREDRRRVSR